MTEEQFWEKDCQLVRYFRQAEEMRLEKQNQMMWLQGMYIYDAIGRIAPVLNPSAKKGTKAKPYVDKPYPITQKSVEEKQKEKDKQQSSKAKAYMEMFAVQYNKRFKEGSG